LSTNRNFSLPKNLQKLSRRIPKKSCKLFRNRRKIQPKISAQFFLVFC
jgi:hypothetical protein